MEKASWRDVPPGGDEYNTMPVNDDTVLNPETGERCVDRYGPFYVSEDFKLLDYYQVTCPYCGSQGKITSHKNYGGMRNKR